MKNVYIFLADGFEEIEGLTAADILRRAGMTVRLVSMNQSEFITGSHQIRIQTDVIFEDADFSDADMLVLPGGMPGTLHLDEHEGLKTLLKEKAEKIWICAICAAPRVLGGLGLLSGHDAACYPGNEKFLTGARVLEETVVVSGKYVTSRGMGTALPFALKLLEVLTDEETAAKMAAAVIWNA